MDEETSLMADPRFGEAVRLFNAGEWYACHDGFEELWHETQGPCRKALQGVLQIAVAQLHLERGNLRGATVLFGEGIGRLRPYGTSVLGWSLDPLLDAAQRRLRVLQQGLDPAEEPLPQLVGAVDRDR
jgi:predicted metal-dependent hydrolase